MFPKYYILVHFQPSLFVLHQLLHWWDRQVTHPTARALRDQHYTKSVAVELYHFLLPDRFPI